MIDIVWFWVIVGVILIIAELVMPGLVVVFLGAAALIVALALQLGLLEGWASSLATWMILSVVLVFALRSFLTRFLPGETRKGNLDEDVEAFGSLARVVGVDHDNPYRGRISFRGSTWDAEVAEGHLEVGMTVRLLARENLIWMVEPSEETLD